MEEQLSNQSSVKESSDAKEFKGFDGRLGSDSGGRTNVTNVHASFSPPAHYNPASGSGMGIGPGMEPSMGVGTGPGVGHGGYGGMGGMSGYGGMGGMDHTIQYGPYDSYRMAGYDGMEPDMGGMAADIGQDPSVGDPFDGDMADPAPVSKRGFKRFVGISAVLTAQWKNQNILGQFKVSFISGSGFKLNQRSLTSFNNQNLNELTAINRLFIDGL